MTPNYRPARQRTGYAVRALDSDGTLNSEAFVQLELLGRVDVAVPAEISEEVEEMHQVIKTWVLPRQTDALGSAMAWMDETECSMWADRFRSWHEVVANAVDEADRHHSGD